MHTSDRGIAPLLLGSVGMKGRQELREDSTILHGVLIITLRKHDEKIRVPEENLGTELPLLSP